MLPNPHSDRFTGLPDNQRALLNKVWANIPNELERFGAAHVFPAIAAMEQRGLALTPKLLRVVLKRLRDEHLLLPSQYRLAKEQAATLLRAYVAHRAPLSSVQ